MPYNSDSGIISAPVSIDDVKRALGESSNDLATLCKSENINIWSKYKPISCKGEFKEYPIREDSEEIVTSSYSKFTCVVRCGMNIPMDTYKNLRNNYGGEGFAIKACNNLHKDNVYGYNGYISDNTSTSVSGKHFPKGGANSPYRLSDFRNYNSKATSNRFLTSLPQFHNVEVYYSSIRKFNCVLYMDTHVDNTNVTMDDIIPDLSLGWSFWIQIRYDSPYNVNDKIYKNYYVGNCKKPTDYVYASKEITFDIGSGDKFIDIVPFLAYTRNATLYDNTKIIFISLPGAITFKYYPRQINMESIKSGSSGFVDFSSLRELVGGTCICKARIHKLPDATITITDGIFRSVCGYGNNKTTYGRGYVSNSSGQITGSVTIPEGDRTDYVDIYIRFDNVYEGGYYGQMCQLSFEINIDGGWKQVPPGGSYIMY
jgi:hypothetical protein